MSTPQTPSSPSTPTATPQQWHNLISQFALFKSQFLEQQQLNQQLSEKVTKLESNSSLQHNVLLTSYETKLEECFYQIEQSTDDVFCQHQLDLLNLISIRVNHLDYRGAALRDLFQLRRGLVPRTVANITVGDLIKWLQKRLKETVANVTQYTYYHTILKSTHFDHPIMAGLNIASLPLNPHYFPTNLMLWSPQPQTPIEYHRFLIAIAYDLDFCETSILPLLTHFGLPVAFPKIPMTSPTPSIIPASVDKDGTMTSPKVNLKVAITKQQQEQQQQQQMQTTDPFPYLGYSTHIPGLLYAPVWFGVLSRDSFRDALHEKTMIDGNSFISARWFSTLCRAGYIFDQITRIICKFPLDGAFYPSHQAYSMMLPRFFASEESLTDPMSYPAFGNKNFPKMYAFLLFIAAHLAITHSTLEQKPVAMTPTVHPPTPTVKGAHPVTPMVQTTPSHQKNGAHGTFSNNNTTTTPLNSTSPASVTPSVNPETVPLTLDQITYPVLRDLFNAAVKGSFDIFSLSVVLKSTELYQHLTPSERNKTNFTRLFGIFHFKVLAGTVPSWLAKPLLGVPKTYKVGSVFEPVCGLPHCEHLTRYFDKSYTNCCDKRAANEKVEKK